MIAQFFNIADFKIGYTIWLFIWIILQISPLFNWIDEKYDQILESGRITGIPMQILTLIWIAIDCHKCLSFWLILILTFNPIVAIWFALLAAYMGAKLK